MGDDGFFSEDIKVNDEEQDLDICDNEVFGHRRVHSVDIKDEMTDSELIEKVRAGQTRQIR